MTKKQDEAYKDMNEGAIMAFLWGLFLGWVMLIVPKLGKSDLDKDLNQAIGFLALAVAIATLLFLASEITKYNTRLDLWKEQEKDTAELEGTDE